MTLFHELTVADIQPSTDHAVVVVFDVPSALTETFRFTPGQYLTLRADIDGEDVRRSYSLCSRPGEAPRVGIKKVEGGRFSTFANERLQVGDRLQVMPPSGRFVVDDEGEAPKHHVAFAAGSGITPIWSIFTYVLETRPQDRFTLIYGNRALSEVMFIDDLHAEKNKHLDRVRIIHCMSREAMDAPLFEGRIDGSKVVALSEAGLLEAADVDVAYVCGPGSMIDEVSAGLEKMGVPSDSVRAERFTAAGVPPAQAPALAEQAPGADAVAVEVVLDGHRRSFAWTKSGSVIEAAASAGIDLPWSCKGGMCSTCRCKVISGEAAMTVNYSLEPWELERGYMLACQAEPRSQKLVLDFDEQ